MNRGSFALQILRKPSASREVSIAEGPPQQRLVEEGLLAAILWAL